MYNHKTLSFLVGCYSWKYYDVPRCGHSRQFLKFCVNEMPEGRGSQGMVWLVGPTYALIRTVQNNFPKMMMDSGILKVSLYCWNSLRWLTLIVNLTESRIPQGDKSLGMSVRKLLDWGNEVRKNSLFCLMGLGYWTELKGQLSKSIHNVLLPGLWAKWTATWQPCHHGIAGKGTCYQDNLSLIPRTQMVKEKHALL